MRKYLFLFGVMAGFLFPESLSAQDDLRVLKSWLRYTDAPNALYHHLANDAFDLLDAREERISRITTAEAWRIRQTEVKQTIWDVLGPFPEKTPLNPKITGKVKKQGYTIENVMYESLPGFFVTASLFIPDKTQKPAPAVLFCSGHSTEAYRKQSYQLPLLNMVKKGFVVLAIDPVGQGERLQYFDQATGKSVIGSSTKEHSYPSVQAALLGQSVARYFTWDGIRGIDYLVSRKEVDAARIGVHGLSGGGTQTAYIAALDDRVTAAAPACYITSYRRLIESIGVQDGEQNFYHGIARGIDHADFLEARAPKPTLVMANTMDFFSIQGARETVEEVKKVYDIFGKPDDLELVEDDYGHGYTRKNREALYAFFQKHLSLPGSPEEEEVEYLTEQELQKTPTGQLSSSFDVETLFSLNRKEAAGYLSRLQKSRADLTSHLARVPDAARQLSGYREPASADEPVFTGRIQKEGYVIEKYYLKGEGEYVLPFLMMIPERPSGKAVLCLHPGGKEAVVKEESYAGWLLRNGFTLLLPDLPGTGELGNGVLKGDAYIDNVSYNLLYTAMLNGRSITGIQAADAVKLSRFLKGLKGVNQVYGLAYKQMAPVMLHAAAFSSHFSGIALAELCYSYRSFVLNRFYKPEFVYSLVSGALTAYDLADLAATLAPVSLTIAGVTNANGEKSFEAENPGQDWEVIREAYQRRNAESRLSVLPADYLAKPDTFLKNWLN